MSFPFASTYASATPLGPIMELRVQDEQNALTARAQAALLLNRNYGAEAEQGFRIATEISPSSPEAVFRYVNHTPRSWRTCRSMRYRDIDTQPTWDTHPHIPLMREQISHPCHTTYMRSNAGAKSDRGRVR